MFSAHLPGKDYRFIDRRATIFVTVVALGAIAIRLQWGGRRTENRDHIWTAIGILNSCRFQRSPKLFIIRVRAISENNKGHEQMSDIGTR